MLLRQAKVLLNGAAEFTSFARDIRGKIEGNLIVGASSDPLSSRIGLVVAGLRDKHPLITVDVCARASAGTRQALKTSEFDIGMLLGRPVDAGFTYYQLATINFLVAGPVAWKDKIENADLAALADLPWITPSDTNLAYSFMLERLFGEKGLELNSVVRFDNAALGRALVQAGVGMLLMREEYALEGVREGHLALSPIARTEYPQFIAHLASRGNDPLIRAFIEAAGETWPDMKRMAPLARN
jgi:DNA-binding transcriptional LysR family regulator